MAATAETPRADEGFVRLAATVPLRVPPPALASLLVQGIPGWEELSSVGGIRRYAVDLRLRLGKPGAALGTFKKAALVDLGNVRSIGDAYQVEIQWRAATAAPLFPVFSGQLHIGPDDIALTGLYAPPGGVVGLVADRTLLHVAATGTARWLLAELNGAATSAR